MYTHVPSQTVTFKEYEQIVVMSQIINNVPDNFSLIIIAIIIKKNQWQNSTPNFPTQNYECVPWDKVSRSYLYKRDTQNTDDF